MYTNILTIKLICFNATTTQYKRTLKKKILTKKLNFENILTVYNKTPQIFHTLNRKPTRSQQKPLTYTYNTNNFRIIMTTKYARKQFIIQQIQYNKDTQHRLQTDHNIHLTNYATQITNKYNKPNTRKNQL